MAKLHITVISLLTVITIIWGVVEIPPAVKNNIDLFQAGGLGTTFSLTPASLTYGSGLVNCNFYENVFADYTDGTSSIVGTNYQYAFRPTITGGTANLVNPTSGQTIKDFNIQLGLMCHAIPTYITSTLVSGSVQEQASVTGSDGQQHVLLNTNISVPTSQVTNNNLIRLGSFTIQPTQISPYLSSPGTNPFTAKFYVLPNLKFVSNLNDGTYQNSNYNSWVTQFYTGNVVNPSASSPGSSIPPPVTTPVVQPVSCGTGQILSGGKCVTPNTQGSGVTVASGKMEFFYNILFQGDPAQYCGTAVPAPAGGACIVDPSSGPLNLSLTSLNIVGSTRGTINSLQIMNIELIMIPSISGLNLDSASGVVYSGAMTIESQTIPIPSSAITSDQKGFVDSAGEFRFPTISLNPVALDQLVKQAGISNTTPESMKIRIYVNGQFTGHNQNGQFKGVINNPYLDISVWYLSNAQAPPTSPNCLPNQTFQNGVCVTPTNKNCNFGTNPDGTCVATPASCTTQQLSQGYTNVNGVCQAPNNTPQPCANGQTGANCQGPSNPTSCPAGQTMVQLPGNSFSSCVAVPPTTSPPPDPPGNPPSPCLGTMTGGVCTDPGNPPPGGVPPPNNGGNGGGGVFFPDPGTNPSGNGGGPSGVCTGDNCTSAFGIPFGNLDTNTLIIIAGFAILIVGIIIAAVHWKKSE